jgi:hypothetical protein
MEPGRKRDGGLMSAAKQSAAPESAAKQRPAATPASGLTPFATLVKRLGNANSGRLLQAKLSVSSPQDQYEQEADRVADQVMRMTAPSTVERSPPQMQRVCSKCEAELHRSEALTPAIRHVDASTENSIASLSTRGNSLPPPVRSFMESRFNADFSAVRIHTDAHAHELARSVQATAFTVGNDVVFGAGHYAPDSESGKRLLAHELTHVVQQVGVQPRLQRQPVGPQSLPPPAPAPAPTPTPADSPFDPDKIEKDMRDEPAVDPIPQVDQRTQIADVNDDAARELVKLIFGDDDVNASVGDLSDVVKDDLDSAVGASKSAEKKAGRLTDEQIAARTQNRMVFLKRLRLYFRSWNDMLKHFREIEEFTSSEGPMDVLLHRSAMEHFKRALATLKAKGHPMPRITSGFQLRKFYQREADRGGPHSAGLMVHALGFAFDAFVKGNPRITYSNAGTTGPERHVFDLQAVIVGKEATAMNLNVGGRDNQTFIAAMGARTLNSEASAADDQDAQAVEYFKVFEQQFNQMLAGSRKFTQSLAPTHRDSLFKLRTDYFAELDAIEAERRKPKPDAAAIAAHRQKRHDLLAAMPPHMAEWVAKLDAEDAHERGKHEDLNMDQLRSPTVIRADQQKNTKDIAGANQKLQTAQAAAARAQAAYQRAATARRVARERKLAAQQALDAAQRAPRSQGNGGDWQARDPKVDTANKALESAQTAVANAEKAANAAWDSVAEFSKAVDAAGEELKGFDKQRTALRVELQGSNLPQLQKSWEWIDRLQELRHWLTAPDLQSPGGLAAFERLMVGDRSERDTRDRVNIADNPPLLRLLDIGYFNPTGAFDLAFFEEMAHHGFVPGASWNPDSVDSMHFQFVAGRNSILEPGKRKP